MGESRTELIAWLNELLQINYTKIEQCGSGAVYCQILDSIYRDIPMARVKMNAKQNYEYLANFKLLQNVFLAKKIDKPIPIEKLVKCKMQDNLEFMQWLKRFWDANYDGRPYDPVARRSGAGDPPATVAPISTSTRSTGSSSNSLSARAAPAAARGKTPVGGPRTGSANAGEVLALQNQVKELTAHLEGLEKERDFYFEKLRNIEILVQGQLEHLEAEGTDDHTLREIQKILYSTEEGFEVPEGGVPLDEEETF